MEKFFKIKQRGSTVSKEVIGGLTTFFAMAYIMFVNPSILGLAAGESAKSSLFMATCLSAALGTLLTALLANVPFAQAPGMGLNAFFTFTVCFGMGYTFQEALAIVLLSGILFFIVSVSPLRGYIIKSIPATLKAAIGAGIGLFIAFIGLINSGSGIVKLDSASNITGLNIGAEGVFNNAALLTLIGLILIGILMAWKVKGSIFIGIIATTLIGIPLGVTQIPEKLMQFDFSMSATFLKLDFGSLFSRGTAGILPLVTAVISFFLVDMFDTVGTLIGTAGNSGMLNKDGNLPGGDRAIIADAVATCAGALLGTSTVTTYVESATGISEGARTGFSSVVVSILFILSLIFMPIALIIPGAATAPALIIVGVLMMKSATKVAWDNIEDAIPAFLTIVMMPFAYSISDGIAFGFISYMFIKVARGKFKEIPLLVYIVSALFIAKYILTVINPHL